jgi:hypothetical protein
MTIANTVKKNVMGNLTGLIITILSVKERNAVLFVMEEEAIEFKILNVYLVAVVDVIAVIQIADTK